MERNLIINRDALKAQMILKHWSVKDICNLLNITDTSFYNKINCKREFTETEICNLVSLFGNSVFFEINCYEISNKKGGK